MAYFLQPDLPTGHATSGFSHNAWDPAGRRFRFEFTDLFCGGGGSGSGITEAIEEWLMNLPEYAGMTKLDVLPEFRGTYVNHADTAINLHALNHPNHRHYCTGVDNVNPKYLYPDGKKVILLWASPECTHYSIARGGKPVDEQSRSTPYCVIRWIRHVQPDVVLVENVREYLGAGPTRQKRDKKTHLKVWCVKAGILAQRDSRYADIKADRDIEITWVPFLRQKGEAAYDYRKRLSAIGWEMALEADPKYKGRKFERWAREIRKMGYTVSWRILCSADYGDPTSRKRLFVQAVRIASGKRIVWPKATHAKPDAQGNVPEGLKPWRTAREIIDWSNKGISIFNRHRYGKKDLADNTMRRIFVGLDKFAFEPYITANFGEAPGQQPRSQSVDDGMPTVTSRGAGNLIQVEPFVVKMYGTNNAAPIDAPSPGVTAGGQHLAVTQGYVVNMKGKSNASSPNDTAPTVTAHAPHLYVAEPFVVGIDHSTGGNDVQPISAPVTSVVTKQKHSVCTPLVMGQHGGATARPADAPVPTVATDGAISVIQPFITKFYGTALAAPIDAPVGTATTKARFGLANGFVLPKSRFKRQDVKSVDTAMQTIDTTSWNVGLAQTQEVMVEGDWKIARTITVAGKTYTLVEVDGWQYLPVLLGNEVILMDVYFRMFTVRELARAQGFSDDYQWVGKQEDMVKAIGNSVSCGIARALALAALSQNEVITPRDVPVTKLHLPLPKLRKQRTKKKPETVTA